MRLADLVVAGMPALMKKYGNKITAHQRKALHAIIDCRTGALGSTLMSCDDCNHKQLRHRSCGHRSCPQCQHHSNQAWLERQQAKLLPVFRPRMLEAMHQPGLTMPHNLPGKWNVQCQHIGKGLPALQYLSRYLYRGMIRDKDLMHFDPDQKQVTFGYRQSQSGEYRYRTLPLDDFLWRITMQVLPKGFRSS